MSAFNRFINHLMASKGVCCFAPVRRYCAIGLSLKAEYEQLKGYASFKRGLAR